RSNSLERSQAFLRLVRRASSMKDLRQVFPGTCQLFFEVGNVHDAYPLTTPTLCDIPDECNSLPDGCFRLSVSARSIPPLLRFDRQRFREVQFLSARWRNRNCT